MGRSLKKKPPSGAAPSVPQTQASIPSFFAGRETLGGMESEGSFPTSPAMSASSPDIEMLTQVPRVQERERDEARREREMSDILQQHIRQLPTKMDIESLFSRMEALHRKDMEDLREDLRGIGCRLGDMEDVIPAMLNGIRDSQETIQNCHQQILQLRSQVEDLEDRHRRNNIRLKGIPETIESVDLPQTVLKIFNELLGNPLQDIIEMDRVHRVPAYRRADAKFPRDVICRLHYYQVKETILNKAREKGPQELKEGKVTLFSDISKQTREKRRALRPVTQALITAGVPYCWGYPFQLRVRKGGHSYTFQTPSDLPKFLKALDLPMIDIDHWPEPSSPIFAGPPKWKTWEKSYRQVRRKLETRDIGLQEQ